MREMIEPSAAAATREQWTAADLAFHRTVLHATGNERMASLFAVIGAAQDGFSFGRCAGPPSSAVRCRGNALSWRRPSSPAGRGAGRYAPPGRRCTLKPARCWARRLTRALFQISGLPAIAR